MEHKYIKVRTPRLNGKVERSHRTDKVEFYQLLEYRDDVDLEQKLADWETFYNLQRHHVCSRRKKHPTRFSEIAYDSWNIVRRGCGQHNYHGRPTTDQQMGRRD